MDDRCQPARSTASCVRKAGSEPTVALVPVSRYLAPHIYLARLGQMSGERVERRLAAILAADVAGYSRLMGADEEGTHERLKTHLSELVEPKIREHRGRVVKNTGDGFLAEFSSVVDAVRCAAEVQRGMAERNAGVAADRRIEFRIGINFGDIIIEDGDIFGDGVNVAARLEALAVPGGICVSGTVRDHVGDRLPYAFEDLGDQQVKNIARAVRVFRIPIGETHASAVSSPELGPLPLREKPSIAVLPFQNMSGDPEQDYFADGMVEEITTAISRLSWLFVIARNSAFTYKGRAVDVKQVAHELGVRYVLEGSVRKAGRRVRITGQLIDTTTGAHIWADRFDGSLEDIFELQDQVASSVAGAIEPKLRRAEMERAGRKPIGSLDAYDVYLRAMAQYYKFTAEGTDVAIALCEQVLAIDEAYAPAAALIANCRRLQRSQGWRPVSQAEIAEAVRLARRAIEIGRDDPDTLKNAAAALYYLGGDNAAASAAIDRALALNPYSARAWGLRGWIDVWLGQPEAALEACEKSMRLSPLDPLGFNDCMGAIAFAHALAGRYDAAVDWADRCLREQPRVAPAIRLKAAACARLGRIEEARDCVRLMREIEPGLTIAYYKSYLAKFAPPDFVTFLVEGLRKAGLPEE